MTDITEDTDEEPNEEMQTVYGRTQAQALLSPWSWGVASSWHVVRSPTQKHSEPSN